MISNHQTGGNMPDVLVRNIDEKTLNNWKKRAAKNNRSLQAELKEMIDSFGRTDPDEIKVKMRKMVEKFEAEGRTFSDSAELIREDRER
jgi:plasmid stability protein